MFSLTHKTRKALVASGLIALSCIASPAHADDLVEHLGPVGPHEPILTTVGSKRVIAFYTQGKNTCALQAVIWNAEDETTSPVRVRIILNQGEMVHIDSPENESLNLQCDDNAKRLAVVEDNQHVAFGYKEPMQPVTASASGF